MAGLTVANYGDLVNATKVDYGPKKIQQIAQNYPSYPLFTIFFKKETMNLDDGQLIQRNAQLKKSPRFRFKHIATPDTIKIEDLTAQMQIPWRFADTHWAFVDQDVYLSRGKAKIFDLIDSRRNDAYLDAVEGLEQMLTEAPSTTDTKTPYGIPYYVVKTSAASTFGFNGTVPGSHTTVANISPTTYANWRNGNQLYTSVTKADLIKKLRGAMRECMFQDLEMLTGDDYRRGRDRYVLLVNFTTISSLEDLGEAQNENIGRDLAAFEGNSSQKDVYRTDGVLTFRRKPILASKHFDADTANPVYGLAMDTWCTYVHEHFNFREHPVKEVADTHGAYYVPVDLWCNILCFDRRRNFVLSTS